MIIRFWSMFIVCSSFFFSIHYCFSDTFMNGDHLVDGYSIVDLPETGMGQEGHTINNEKSSDSFVPRRLKRSALSLPRNTSARFVIDWITPVAPLKTTFTFLTLDLIFRFVLPTYTQLNALYSTLGRLGVDDGDSETSNGIDYEFFEEQRAHKERRSIYEHAEDLFQNFGFDGQTCLLRAICEMAEAPLFHHGLVGKLIDLIFTPTPVKIPKSMESYLNSNRVRRDITNVPELEVLHRPVEDDYTHAYLAGKEGKCWTRYYTCPVSIFKLIKS